MDEGSTEGPSEGWLDGAFLSSVYGISGLPFELPESHPIDLPGRRRMRRA
jgi:hypothetical protein